MEVIKVSQTEFDNPSLKAITPFHTGEFASLHEARFDQIYYLHFVDSRLRAGLTIGVKDNSASSPFSAPFGGWTFNSKSCTIKHFHEISEALIDLGKREAWNSIRITIPPEIYDSRYCSYTSSALYSHGFNLSHFDVNYHFDVERLDNYQEVLWRNARKNLNRALQAETDFTLAESEAEKKEVYNTIKKNRDQRGYPLRMTFDQVIANSDIIEIDFLALRMNSVMIASAIVYHLTPELVMVVYWGDDIEYMDFKPMNILSFRVFEYYRSKGKRYVDIGPSSESGVPAFGLCDFKESIGCEVTLKSSFVKQL